MKNFWKRLIALLCATVLMGSTLAGCKDKQMVITAYDIAVQNGFVGTEEDWLLSLQGANGKDGEDLDINDLYLAAKAEGFEGTLLDFIYSLGVEVQESNDTKVIAKNLTSVVSITCAFIQTKEVGNYWNKHEEKTVTGAEGSGVVVELEKNRGVAYIVTNYHVVYDVNSDTGISKHIWIYPYGARDTFTGGDINNGIEPGDAEGGDGIRATFVGGAMDYDIAILKVTSTKLLSSVLTQATLGDSESVTVGEKTHVLGNAGGFGLSVTSGVLSVESEYIKMQSADGERTVNYRVMRTDAAINHGNSGGGLFNAQGQLIGIVNAKHVAEATDNMGYALPITVLKYAMQNIWDHQAGTKPGYIRKATLGVETYITQSKATLKNGTLKIVEEFVVSKVPAVTSKNDVGPSTRTNFKVGDVFISMTHNGVTTQFTRQYQLDDLLLNVRKGDSVTFTVRRDSVIGKKEVQVTIVFDEDKAFIDYT